MAASRTGARQIGRRAMVVCGALVVPPWSSVYTPQELAHKLVALDFGNGTAYAGLQMLESAMPRQAITTCSFDANPALRYSALMAGEFAATVLQEPWITVAEKAGCRLVSSTFFYGTWVASDQVESATYAAFVSATTAAVQRINADKKRYLHYYTREYADYAAVRALTPDDFNLGRIQVKAPEPIGEAEARLEWEWMASWGLLHGQFDADKQINTAVQQAAHAGR